MRHSGLAARRDPIVSNIRAWEGKITTLMQQYPDIESSALQALPCL